MKKALKIAAVILLSCFSINAFANEPEDLSKQFMTSLVAGKISEAVDQYLNTNPIVSQKPQQLAYLKTQIEGAIKIFGTPHAFESVIKESISLSLHRFVYISKHQYHTLSWEFYVYKPKNEWIASNINFNDEFNLLESKK